MAWIESHQELRHHYKTKRLARELKVTVAAAVGHLHFLWWWAIDFAPDGDLSKFDDHEIADAIGYEGKDHSKAKTALIAAGFLDNTNEGTVTIHDWQEYAGRTLAQRKKTKASNRDRQKRYRDRKSASKAEAQTRDNAKDEVTVTPEHAVSDQTVTRYAPSPVTSCNAPTEHNSTEQNITEQYSTEQDGLTPPLPPAGGGKGEGVELDLQERQFEEFWGIYPKKQGKGAALKRWKRIKPDKALFEQIMSSVRANISRNEQWRRDGGQYIPNPETWLNQMRWLDEIPNCQRGDAINVGGRTERIGGADSYHDFQRSTGFRSADSDTDADG